ncbi:MAG: outer membrane lipoprotein-sorting protein [bacterium]
MTKFMKSLGSRAILVVTVLFLGPSVLAAPLSLKPREILDKVDDLFRGEANQGRMTMTITTAHWKRKLSLEFQNKGRDKALYRIVSPKKEKGTATLRSGKEIWNYLPKIKRVIKLPSSMMSASWMGSHFSNDDLVKQTRMADDFSYKVTHGSYKNQKAVVEITCIPHPEAAVVWGKVVVRVRKPDFLPLVILYYDEDLNLARTFTYMNVRHLGGRTLPTMIKVVPTDKPNESTVVEFQEITFDLPLEDRLFSLRNLQR